MTIKHYFLFTTAIALVSGIVPSAKAQTTEAVLERLERIEKENALLRQRLNRIESKKIESKKEAVANTRSASPRNDEDPASARATYLPPLTKVPVDYVRVCSIEGEGFFYIPGTPGCIKIGGYLRLQGAVNASGDGIVTGADTMAPQGRLDRFDSNDINYQARAAMSFDVRFPTAWGQLRGYVRGGFQIVTPFNSAAAPAVWWDRGFVQFAGFTVGKQRSFFDMFDPVSSYTYGNPRITGDTDLDGAIMAGYTRWFGGGFSASIAVEDPSAHDPRGGVANMAMGELGLGTLATNNGLAGQQQHTLNGFSVPDVVANARFDQPWGYVAVSGAAHDVAGAYYGGANNVNNGHPADKFGFAGSAAAKLFVPGMGGDSVGANFVYTRGAPGYATRNNVWQLYGGNGTAAFAWLPDGVYDNNIPNAGAGNTAIELTTVWSINGLYQHIWSQQWKSSLYGGFTSVRFNANATNIINQHLPTPPLGGLACGVAVEGAVAPPLAIGNGVGNSCSPNFSFSQLGSRTQYSPVPWLDVGVDVVWTHLNTAYKGPNVTLGANGARPGGIYSIADQDVLTVLGRVQLNWNP